MIPFLSEFHILPTIWRINWNRCVWSDTTFFSSSGISVIHLQWQWHLPLLRRLKTFTTHVRTFAQVVGQTNVLKPNGPLSVVIKCTTFVSKQTVDLISSFNSLMHNNNNILAFVETMIVRWSLAWWYWFFNAKNLNFHAYSLPPITEYHMTQTALRKRMKRTIRNSNTSQYWFSFLTSN